MNILVFNCGSSSLTFKLFYVEKNKIDPIFIGKAHRVGVKGTEPSFIEYWYDQDYTKTTTDIESHSKAAKLVFRKLRELDLSVYSIGHRWGHSLGRFTSTLITDDFLKDLRSLVPLMPIHHPAMLSVIQNCIKQYPHAKQYVTADGSFHSTIPYYAHTYALPKDISEKYGFRKYGFHGLSYQFVVGEVGKYLNTSLKKLKIIACHLGTGGSSICAIKYGRSIDTSMGYSALPGLMMSTRSGDLDPMLTLYLAAAYGYRSDDLVNMLNKKSGLIGISGISSDLRDIIHGVNEENQQADLAFRMYSYRLKKYIGSYITALSGLDVLIFTDDIGIHNWQLREKVCDDMEWSGMILDKKLNKTQIDGEISLLNTDSSKVKILSVPTEEELVICKEGIKLLEH